MPLAVILATAFTEGLCVLLIEIVGARSMAPYFGSTLMVWTAQITATLLFLALGYRLGGVLARRPSPRHLPLLFALAGAWLFLYRLMRAAIMGAMAAALGIPAGSFASATVLFGVPLLCLGAVSPVLIGAIDRSRPGAGSAAGSVFFVNTMGGLAGGWATAFLVIPYFSVSTALSATGTALAALAGFWAAAGRGPRPAVAGLVAAGLASGALFAAGAHRGGAPLPDHVRLLFERQSSIGTLQVIDDLGSGRRLVLLDGAPQNEIDLRTGSSRSPYTDCLEELAVYFAPDARHALALGLGAGIVPRALAHRGVEVTAVEIEPRMVQVAREYFALPDDVHVVLADARTHLRRDPGVYDLVLLDVYAAETPPWHLLTVDAFREIAARLAPGGRLLINTYTTVGAVEPGLARIEAALLDVFPEVMVFTGVPVKTAGLALTNATLVAGAHLDAGADRPRSELLRYLLSRGRPARAEVPAPTDEWSDLDYAEAGVRARYRDLLLRVVPRVGG